MMANQEEAEAEESQDVAADDAAADEPRFSAVSEVVNDEPIDAPNTNVEDLEELKKLSDHGFLEADWGVNTAQLRDACMDSFLEICPASVPAVFYDDIHRFPPPGVGMVGLAPSDSDAHCWMDCASKNYDALPYDCQVASDRMMAWIRAHGSDAEYVEPPQMLFLGLALHFLFLTLLIVGLARCVVVFCRLRRRRYHLVAAPVEESKLQVVKAITIQIPKSARSASGEKSDDAPILVQGTVVSRD